MESLYLPGHREPSLVAQEKAVRFSVVYSVDVPQGVRIKNYTPPQVSRLWSMTEAGESEYSYLSGRWTRGKHRKWVALLTRKQFDAFVDRLGLYAEKTETMGSLGAPGFGFGWSPAISFNADFEDAILNAYVTPIPETTKEGGDERDWQRVRKAVLSAYAA
jgi:hypothetical protein